MFATTPSSLFPLLTFSLFCFFFLFTISFRLSLAARNAGRIGVYLRAVRYRGRNGGGGCRSRSRDRRRIRARRALLLLLGVLQITRIQQRRKIPRLVHTAGDDTVAGAVLLALPRVRSRRCGWQFAVDAQQSANERAT